MLHFLGSIVSVKPSVVCYHRVLLFISTGQAPTVRNSANKVHHGRITKKDNKLVRYVLVEGPQSHAIRAKFQVHAVCMRI